MSNWAWVPIGFYVISALAAVSLIGKKRDPITPATAIGTLILTAALIFCVVLAAT